jgi:hypothetical protein
MAKKQTELTERLFDLIEHLEDRSLTGEKLTEEIARSKAITEAAGQIVANGALILSACRISETASRKVNLPLLLSPDEEG